MPSSAARRPPCAPPERRRDEFLPTRPAVRAGPLRRSSLLIRKLSSAEVY